ncbi:LuxR C-terminal-related transcriptional regulator [Actinoplanes oblitus]|uniref:LuxR C-terminal-related transcriptional regulator n=1 Tax=Actinoplanes oblitus TaxID=3040509 RepID=A0ABY8WJE1_9ACTN|nr:helix-turn-helix transcriptional regulator [Actinoplanes oblitus]WIM95865.1 LuxR C-terminal-related transcriptional regulator [Actinoplanes oblitus]
MGEISAGPRLLERSGQLGALHQAYETVRGGRGGVLVLLGGEAGGGKTALVRRFRAECRATRPVLWGACDPLRTPRPLGPFLEIAHDGGPIAGLVERGAKSYELATGIIRDVRERPGLALVLEDLHWADEATLDVLSVLGRRIEAMPALIVATYRSDEVTDRRHPLRRLLGELQGDAIHRMAVAPLSPEAVGELAAPHGRDGRALHRVSGGNPFFVTEVLARDDGDVPLTVRDAVLARAARLGPEATAVLDAVSVVPQHAELHLLAGMPGLDEALRAGMLESVPGGVAFRHELARIAVEESLAPHRRLELHRGVLRALLAEPERADPSRVAHHAEAAGATDVVLTWAPRAAEQAAGSGAHREAAAQYARALRFAAGLAPAERAGLLERRSYECYLTEQTDESIVALREAIRHRRRIGDRHGEATALSLLSRRQWCGGYLEEAAASGREALRLLDDVPTGPEYAMACTNQASIALNIEDYPDAMELGGRALRLGERHGSVEIVVHSLNNLGTMQLLAGEPAGIGKLERSLALAEQAGLEEHIGRAYIHAGWSMTRVRSYHLSSWLDRGVTACADLGLEAWKHYVLAYRARYHLDMGRWGEAAADAGEVLRDAKPVPLLRLMALAVLGLIRARGGDADPWPALDEARDLAAGKGELQYLAPVATARAEAAWLAGVPVEPELTETWELALRRRAAWVLGELAWLRRLAGGPDADLAGVRLLEPYAPQLAGDVAGAAECWRKRDCSYDAALALAGAGDEAGLRAALAEFQRLGARPAATIVTRRLRSRGVRDIPRGPQRRTRENPAELTRREVEVLALIRRGLSNVEIAERLFLSTKTVHHHVSAILRKLGVSRRGQAVAEAARLGLTP